MSVKVLMLVEQKKSMKTLSGHPTKNKKYGKVSLQSFLKLLGWTCSPCKGCLSCLFYSIAEQVLSYVEDTLPKVRLFQKRSRFNICGLSWNVLKRLTGLLKGNNNVFLAGRNSIGIMLFKLKKIFVGWSEQLTVQLHFDKNYGSYIIMIHSRDRPY